VDRRELRARTANLARNKLLTDRLEDTTQVVYALANAVEAKDAYTEGHTDRVGRLGVRMAQRIGMGAEAEDALQKGGVLHDIGKIGIPSAIINKPGMLTPGEKIVMEKHPMIGERICEPLKSIRDLLPIIRWHHERLDGTGYPDRIKGAEFPLICQVMQLADIYDAITTDRPYHRARTRDGALEFMMGEAKKGWRDPELVKVCRAAAEDVGFGRLNDEEIPPPPAPLHLWRWE
jgi:putative two-component system response regulator